MTKVLRYTLLLLVILGSGFSQLLAQVPSNDNCSNAETIVISNNGFGLGNFTSPQINMTNATVQAGETFAPAIFVAGLDKKSVWFRFSLPTIRAVRVTLSQPATDIPAGDAGFAVYKTSNCLPVTSTISTKLTPIVTWGNTYHPCVPAGDYLVQVSSKITANGPISITVEISDQTGAAYDHPADAYAFGTANVHTRKIDFDTECQSIEDATEVCTSLHNYNEYHKSAWFTFTTPAYLDYLVVALSGTGTPRYFPSGAAAIQKKFGYNLYQGNAVTTPINALLLIDGCDSLLTNGDRCATVRYRCGDLQPNTTYSIQLFIHKDFSDMVRLGIITGGTAPTAGPLPVNSLPPSNAIGTLASSGAGTPTTVYDNFGCNSRHSTNPCDPVKPAAGVTVNNVTYNLSSFFTFNLNSAAAITFRPGMLNCGPRPVIRLFKQSLTANCNDLSLANLVGTAAYNQEIECLTPGNYVMQVLGMDTVSGTLNTLTYVAPANNSEYCLFNNLGSRFQVQLIAYNRQAASNYSLFAPGKFDSINRVGAVQQPLADGITYQSNRDTIGCEPTLRPWDTTCSPLNDKIIYRQLIIADSGTVEFDNMIYSNNPPVRYRLYKGDANNLATAQNVFAFPDRVSGIVPQTLCMDGDEYCRNKSVCITAGTYTFTTMASVGNVGNADRPSFTFRKTRTQFNSPANAYNMGSIMDTLGPNGGTLRAKRDYWSCNDNAIAINGYTPCTVAGYPATKAIYRQFYLKEDAVIRFSNPGYGGWCVGQAYGTRTMFYGKATDGMAGLTPVGNQWNCFSTAGTTNNCSPLPAGWYTVVSWGTGPNYENPMTLTQIGGKYNAYVNYFDEFDITVTPACPGPKFNRPYKASVAAGNTPHLIQWFTRNISTPVYPRTDTIYRLPAENFNCIVDTPFSSHPVDACEAAANRVTYYVFQTTQECFLQINTNGYYAAVYDKDVRTDSLLIGSATPVHPCNASIGYIQFCHFQPGTYTLVIFAKDANICRSVAPSIFIDRVDYSRFDYAAKAYDFGTVPPDATYHFGKTGDVNPLHPSRPPSSDFIYCTTGASASDPANAACNVTVNDNIYSTAVNQPLYNAAFPQVSGKIARRNLWYTFVTEHPGTVYVKVENKTTQRGMQPRFAVFSSDADPALPFSDLQTGNMVDSTIADGLKFVTMNYITGYYCYNAPNNVSFYRNPCTSTPTRYYILVDNVNGISAEPGGQLPNTQVDVSIRFDSFNLVLPKFDHYYQASGLGSIGAGTFSGEQDNYSCATRDNPDPLPTGQNGCSKTLWYKFTSTITGNVRYRIRIGNSTFNSANDILLFKESVPGDSTTNGLKIQAGANVSTGNGSWMQSCVTTGTYYLLLPGCNRVNQYVIPEIELIEQEGDFCSRAVPATINGAGSATASVLVNCHTIGTDYGEFGPALTCPQDAVTAQYKTSWFRMDIGGTDTLDVTTFLTENTNAASGDIKYRMMTGDCGAMQEQSCVLDALTQNTYECLVPGQSYYIQVFTPVLKNNVAVTGTIALQVSAVAHADTCLPLNNCLASANFLPSFDCTKDASVQFINYSTFGNNISYQWNLGHNGATSNAVSPSYFYPALPVDSTYTIRLIVKNNSCNKSDTVIKTFTVPARPSVNLGADIIQCNSTAPVILRATSHPGATYLWQNNSTADTFRITATGNNNYRVRVTYNGCVRADTIRVLISPISGRPLQQINLCTDSVLVDVRRGSGETYLWNTGATTRSIYMSTPGYYWADITYADCVYRDSFEVNNINEARPFGNDTTVCLAAGGFILRARMNGAISYRWQNNSTADTLLVTTPGQYRVEINFGNCIIRDTILISAYAAPVVETTDTSICAGNTYLLPSGTEVAAAGTYRDTLQYAGGCDSLIRIVNLTVKSAPHLGNDTSFCTIPAGFTLDGTTAGATGYIWQDGSANPTYTITTAGTYWVQVNHDNCTTSDSINITLLSNPVLQTIDTTLCTGSTLTLSSGIRIQGDGTYTDTLKAAAGCDSMIITYTVTFVSAPLLGNDRAVQICYGQNINLNNYYNITGLQFSWTIAGNPVTNPSNVNTAGNYRLIAVNNSGCSDTALLSLTVNSLPLLGNDTALSICEQHFLDLTRVYNIAGLTAQWTTGGNTVANPAAVNTAGVYELIAANAAGCSDTPLLTVTVNLKPDLGNDAAVTMCEGDTADVTAFFNTAGLSPGWTKNGNTVSDPSAITTAGLYQLIATNADGCSDTASVTVSFNPKPNLGNDTSRRICPYTTVDLSSVINTTGLNTQWSYNNAAVTDPAAVSVPGNYQLTATNNFGCADTLLFTLLVDPKPVTGIDIDTASCNFIDLSGLYNTTGLLSSWTFSNQPVSNTVIHINGLYQLIATNTAGCSDTALVTFSLYPKPIIGNDTAITVCSGKTVDLTNLYNTGILSTQWFTNNTTVLNPGAVTAAGLYELHAGSNQGCSDTAILTLTVNPKPSLGNDRSISICSDSSINLSNLYNTGTNTNAWSINNTPVTDPSFVNTAGSYQLISSTTQGCSDTVNVQITISPVPQLLLSNPGILCKPQTADLTSAAVTMGSSPGLLFTYWQDSAAAIALNTPAAVTDGTYYIKAVNNTGCFSIQPVTVTSYPVHTVNAGNDKGICDSDSTVLLSVQVGNTNAAVTYNWQPAAIGNIRNPVGASTIVQPVASPQEYIVTVTDGYGCNYQVSDTVAVTKQPRIHAFAGNDTVAVMGVPHQLLASGGVDYLWEPAGLLNNAGIFNPLATIYADSILFTLTVTDDKGCKGYDTVKVKTYDGITYYVPSAFSPNGDGINDIFKPLPVGIVTTEYFRVFNRYGELMFETSKYGHGWDGNYKGKPQLPGNYVWVVKGKSRSGKLIEMKGNVVLLR